MTKLSEHQQKAVDAFKPKGKDIDIVVLYTRVYGDPGQLTAREMQQKLAPTFSAINEKLTDSLIEPGALKRTYRFSKIKKWG